MSGLKKTFVAGVVVIVGVVGVNAVRAYAPARDALKNDSDVVAIGHYHMGVVPDSIVYDLWSVGMSANQVQVMGGFFRFAENLKDREFREVRLAYRGETRFIMSGADFNDIGRGYSDQNPVYVLRTLPEKLHNPDGSKAFKVWTGGMLGVLNAQLEDINEVGQRWFIGDIR